MVDYTDGTLNALAGGFNFGRMVKDARDEQQFNRLAQLSYEAPQEQRQSLLGQMAAISPRAAQQQEQSFASADERRNTTMVNMAKLLTSAPEQARPALWQRFVPTLSQFGLSQLPTEYNAETAPVIDQAAQSLVQAYGGGVGGNVQSTYIDGNGNRVAIMRDGSQRVLGPNNASIRVMEQEGALPYGVVTSGGRPGAVVDIGGAQIPAQGATGQYTIDPSLPPEVQQQIRAAEAAGQQVPSNMVIPPRSGPVPVPTAAQRAYAAEAGRNQAQTDNFANSIEQDRIRQEQQARIEADKTRAVEQAKSEQERASVARAKSAALNNVDRGIDRMERALKALNRGLISDTGPVDSFISRWTKEGDELTAAIGSVQDSMLALTRVPGVGSQSDLEARMANLKYPGLSNYPATNQNNLAQLRAFVEDLRKQFGSESTVSTSPDNSEASERGSSIDALLEKYR